MITYRELDKRYFKAYDGIEMLVHVNSYYALEKINNVPAFRLTDF